LDVLTEVTTPSGPEPAGERAEACPACGASPGECSCARVRDALHGRAAALRRAGMAAARAGELHRSAALLRDAARLAPLAPEAARVLGLAALCLGEVRLAAQAWRRAEADEAVLFGDGPVRDALRAYNDALGEARAGNTGGAAARVDEALRLLPDLVPAHRLRALVAAERGDGPAARAACEAGLATCSDDPVLLRCLASLAVSADASVPVSASADVASAVRPRPRSAVRAGVGAAWAATVALAIFLTSRLQDHRGATVLPPAPLSRPADASPPRAAPPAIGPPAAAPAAAFDFAAYRRGREAFARSEWRRAASELGGAAAAPAGAYYRDDALYLLARAQARASRPGDARATAALLLRDHPASIFANHVTRRLAGEGAE
jgi:hypothetical protein